jgi:hypothetical protein
MSKHEIDIMWQKAMKQSIEDGEMFTRYHFAKLVAERALADSMQEVQRLGQEIEQEPEVDLRTRWPMNGWKENKSTPPQRTEPLIGCVNHDCAKCKPLTDEQRKDLMNKAWNKWLSRKDDGHLFAWDFSFEVEAAHGIKEDT